MASTFIPFPSIPQYPGVPQLVRPINAAIAENPVLSIALGSVENLLISALQQTPKWGIFDAIDGSQLGVSPNTQSILQAIGSTLISQVTGGVPTRLSTFGVEFMREARVSEFPVENGGFASFNKAQMPANPRVTLILQGSANDRTYLLDALESATISTDLYNVVTPEFIYTNYSIERYSYSRRANKGVTLLEVEVSLKEIRQVSPALSSSPIVAPQNPAAAAQVSAGTQQPTVPAQSALLSLNNGLLNLLKPYLP